MFPVGMRQRPRRTSSTIESGARIDRLAQRSCVRVPKIGAKSFEQAAGFLRIADGVEFLDRTGIHPESYPLARQVLQALGLQTDQMGSTDARAAVAAVDADALCERLHGDPYTIRDILDAIAAPLQDYRDQFEPVLLKERCAGA